MANAGYLLKYGLYFKPDNRGYTGLKREAGLYFDDNPLLHYDDTSFVSAVEADMFSPSCACDVIDGERLRLTKDLCTAVELAAVAIISGLSQHDDDDPVIDKTARMLAATKMVNIALSWTR